MIESLKNKLRTIQEELTEKLIETNIKKDVTILGVTGSYVGSKIPNGTKLGYSQSLPNDLDTSEVTTFNAFFREGSFSTMPQIDTSNGTTMEKMFYYCRDIVTVPTLNTGKVTKMRDMFNACNALVSFSFTDTSKVTDMNGMFRQCYALVSCPQFDCSLVEDMNAMFANCTALETILITSAPNNKDFRNAFYNCPALTNDGLNNILALLASATNYTQTKTLSSTGLTAAQIATCETLSNWTTAQNAGWSAS